MKVYILFEFLLVLMITPATFQYEGDCKVVNVTFGTGFCKDSVILYANDELIYQGVLSSPVEYWEDNTMVEHYALSLNLGTDREKTVFFRGDFFENQNSIKSCIFPVENEFPEYQSSEKINFKIDPLSDEKFIWISNKLEDLQIHISETEIMMQ